MTIKYKDKHNKKHVGKKTTYRKVFDSEAYVKYPKDVKHYEVLSRYNCESCDRKFKCPMKLTQHVNSAHKGRRFICDLCQAKFENYTQRWHHNSILHDGKATFTVAYVDVEAESVTTTTTTRKTTTIRTTTHVG